MCLNMELRKINIIRNRENKHYTQKPIYERIMNLAMCYCDFFIEMKSNDKEYFHIAAD
jgi:hypothetical protein